MGVTIEADAHGLRLDVPDWPGHRPGQFAMLELDPDRRHLDPLLPRPMAIYRRDGDALEFRFKPVGRGTRLLGERRPGARVGLVGPLGNGFERDPNAPGRSILIGGGTGIASLWEFARETPGATVLLGGRTEREILGLRDFADLDVELEVATDDGSLGRRGLVTELLAPSAGDTVYACGPTPMMERAATIATEAGASCRVSLETHMACGFGVCLGCAVPTTHGFRYVCTHGPVFDSAELDWVGLP